MMKSLFWLTEFVFIYYVYNLLSYLLNILFDLFVVNKTQSALHLRKHPFQKTLKKTLKINLSDKQTLL